MAFLLVAFVCLLPAVLGGEFTQKCCPSNWQAIMVNTSEINDDAVGYSHFYYDYDLQKDAMQHMRVIPGSPPFKDYRLVHDYSRRKLYVIPEGGVCFSIPIPMEMFPPCTSENSSFTFIGAGYVGPQDIGLETNAVRFMYEQLKLTITLHDCVPILEGIKGPGIDVVLFYSQYKTPITDRSVFDLPHDCEPEEQSDE